jgi:hypothetical protein
MDYEMAWYPFDPLFRIHLNCEFYYRLSTLGGVYASSKSKVLVSRRS